MSPTYLIGYVLGGVMLALGIAILGGAFDGRGGMFASTMPRTVFGVVLLLYGIYRILMTNQARRRAMRNE